MDNEDKSHLGSTTYLCDDMVRVNPFGNHSGQTVIYRHGPDYFEEAMKRFATPATPPRTVAAAVALALLPPPAMTLLQSPAAPGTT